MFVVTSSESICVVFPVYDGNLPTNCPVTHLSTFADCSEAVALIVWQFVSRENQSHHTVLHQTITVEFNSAEPGSGRAALCLDPLGVERKGRQKAAKEHKQHMSDWAGWKGQ